MRRIFTLIFILFIHQSWGQSDFLLSLIEEADSCAKANIECLELYVEAVEQAEKEKAIHHLSPLYYKLGRTQFILGDHEKAEEAFENGIQASIKYGDSSDLAMNYGGLGTLAFMKGQMDVAISYYLDAVHIQEELKDPTGLSLSLINVSAALYNLKDFKESLKYLFRAHDILKNETNNQYLGTVKGNIAIHYYQLKSYDSAQFWSMETIKISEDNPQEIEAYILGHYTLSAVLLEKNMIPEARSFMRKAIKKAREYDLQHYLGEALGVYARILARSGDYTLAIETIEEVKEIQGSFNNYLGLAQAYRIGGEVYNLSKNYEKATENYAQFIVLYDSLLMDGVTEKVIELNKKYQAAQKEQELLEQKLKLTQTNIWLIVITAILIVVVLFFISVRRKLSIRFLKQQRDMKEKQMEAWFNGEQAERERLSKELHDGVASMVSAAKMNLETTLYLNEEEKEKNVQKVLSILNETHQDVRMVAHDLMPISLQKKNLWEAVEDYIDYFKNPRLNDIDVYINPDLKKYQWHPLKKVALYRILQELIQNVYKHSEATYMLLHCDLKNEFVVIKLSDNGKGFGDDAGHGLGMKSIKDRVLYLNGEIEIDSIPNSKTEIKLVIPVKSFSKL